MAAGMMPNLTSEVAKTALVERDGDVAGGGQPHAAAERGALHAGDGRLLHHRQRAQHVRQRAGVVLVVGDAVVGGALHPVEVGAGREAAAAAGEDDDADVLVAVEGDAGGRQLEDQVFVEGVVQFRPVHPDRRDRAVQFDFEGHEHVSRSFIAVAGGSVRPSARRRSAAIRLAWLAGGWFWLTFHLPTRRSMTISMPTMAPSIFSM